MFRGSVRVNLCRYVTPKFSIFLFNQADYFNKYKNLLGYFALFVTVLIVARQAGISLFLFGSAGNQSQEKGFIFSLDGTRGGEGEVDPKALKAKRA